MNGKGLTNVWANIPVYAAFFEITKEYFGMDVGDIVYMRKGDPTTIIHKKTNSRAYVKVSCLKFIAYMPISGHIQL